MLMLQVFYCLTSSLPVLPVPQPLVHLLLLSYSCKETQENILMQVTFVEMKTLNT